MSVSSGSSPDAFREGNPPLPNPESVLASSETYPSIEKGNQIERVNLVVSRRTLLCFAFSSICGAGASFFTHKMLEEIPPHPTRIHHVRDGLDKINVDLADVIDNRARLNHNARIVVLQQLLVRADKLKTDFPDVFERDERARKDFDRNKNDIHQAIGMLNEQQRR